MLKDFWVLLFLHAAFCLSNVDCFTGCDPFWTYHNQRCYKIFGESDELNWDDAKERCLSKNAHLVNINSTENDRETGVVEDVLRRSLHNQYTEYPVWIGLRREPVNYHWVDNTPFNSSLFPIDDFNHKSEDGNCFVMTSDTFFQSCIFRGRYICKKILDPSLKACDGTWKSFRNSCYLFSNVAIRYEQAVKKCQGYGAHLTSIADEQELKFLQSNEVGYGWTWIGLKRNDLVLTWTENSTVNEENLVGRVKYWFEDYFCLQLYGFGFDGEVILRADNCEDEAQYMCEKPAQDLFTEILVLFGVLILLVVFCVALILIKRKSLRKELEKLGALRENDETFVVVADNATDADAVRT